MIMKQISHQKTHYTNDSLSAFISTGYSDACNYHKPSTPLPHRLHYFFEVPLERGLTVELISDKFLTGYETSLDLLNFLNAS